MQMQIETDDPNNPICIESSVVSPHKPCIIISQHRGDEALVLTPARARLLAEQLLAMTKVANDGSVVLVDGKGT